MQLLLAPVVAASLMAHIVCSPVDEDEEDEPNDDDNDAAAADDDDVGFFGWLFGCHCLELCL